MTTSQVSVVRSFKRGMKKHDQSVCLCNDEHSSSHLAKSVWGMKEHESACLCHDDHSSGHLEKNKTFMGDESTCQVSVSV